MSLSMSICIHLEQGDPVAIQTNEFPDHSFCTLVIREPDTYGDLTIFFPRESLATVQEIARLIEQARKQSADAPKETVDA